VAEHGEELVLAAVGGLEIAKQAGVGDRHRGVGGEGLDQPHLLVGVDPPDGIAHGERAHHARVDHERRREDRAGDGRLDPLAYFRIPPDGRIGQDVRGRDHALLRDRSPGEPDAARDDHAWLP
jgi:hypothetical protein